LDTLQRDLPAGITIDRKIFRQADFIEVAVDNVVKALRDGGLLVIVIVVLFLANLRAAAITLTAMPLSLAAAILVLRAFGASINTMTLGGMAIAIGALLDDAIIDVENVVRRLRANAAKPEGERRPNADVVRDLEIRTSIVFATVIIVLVFLPIFGLTGVEGRLLTPLAVAYIVSLIASLLVAIVVTPALSYAFLPRARSIARGHDGWLARTLKARFAKDLPRALDHPHVIAMVSTVLLMITGFGMTRMGSGFLPDFHEGSLTVQANTLPGTSLAKSDEIGRRVEQILLSEPEVVATARRTGRAELDEHVQGVEAAEIDAGLRETKRSRAELLADLRRGFSTLPGTNVTIGQPISRSIPLAAVRSRSVSSRTSAAKKARTWSFGKMCSGASSSRRTSRGAIWAASSATFAARSHVPYRCLLATESSTAASSRVSRPHPAGCSSSASALSRDSSCCWYSRSAARGKRCW
jgi:Cu/Ag efflux pump CusA